MKTITVAIGRIYNARSAEIDDSEIFAMRFNFENISVKVTIGDHLKHIVLVNKVKPELKNKVASKRPDRHKEFVFPGYDVFPANVYLEIVAYQDMEVTDQLYSDFKRGEKSAADILAKMLKKEEKKFYTALDFVGGFLGFELDSELVSSLIIEQTYLYYPESKKYKISSSFTINTIETFELSQAETKAKEWKNLFTERGTKTSWKTAAQPLGWVLRGWGTKDRILKFVSFFTAIEMVIPGFTENENKDWLADRDQIRSLLDDGSDNSHALLSFIDKLQPPASILDRFTTWAKREAKQGWENDVSAFKKFSRMRNALLHRGIQDFDFKVVINEKDILTLEYIAKRYILAAIFENM